MTRWWCPRLGALLCAVLTPLAGTGTPEEDSAWQWLETRGGAVRRIDGLAVPDTEVERLSNLRLSLPALESASGLCLQARHGAAPAATQAFLTAAARAVARCPRQRALDLRVELMPGLGGQLPEALGRELARARALEELSLSVESREVDRLKWPVAASVSHLVTGLAGLSRLRALILKVDKVGLEATLPACLSRLAQLTSLTLCGFYNLRCAPGWASLPALEILCCKECFVCAQRRSAAAGHGCFGVPDQPGAVQVLQPARAARVAVAAVAAAQPRLSKPRGRAGHRSAQRPARGGLARGRSLLCVSGALVPGGFRPAGRSWCDPELMLRIDDPLDPPRPVQQLC